MAGKTTSNDRFVIFAPRTNHLPERAFAARRPSGTTLRRTASQLPGTVP